MFNFLVGVIANFGLWAVFFLMLADNLVPVIPSELILPLVGYQAARGQFPFVVAILAGTAGSSFGGMAWYGVGYLIGLERLQRIVDRHGRWLPITRKELAQARAWFGRWGELAICVSRMLPGVPAAVCMPAGVARMPFLKFAFWSTLGAGAWATLLISVGIILNAHYALVQRWLDPAADIVFIFCVSTYLYRVITYRAAELPTAQE